MAPDWFPDWSGQVCGIIAGGQTVHIDEVNALRGRCRTIAVNCSYQLAPWADALYAADEDFWKRYPVALRFEGLKITRESNIARYHGLRTIRLTDKREDESNITVERKGYIARGGNSGFQAINLAVQFGVRKLLLLGFDFYGDHWHAPHPQGMANPRPHTLARWAETLDRQAPVLAALGVEVINCSHNSRLTAYRKSWARDAVGMLEAVA